MLKKTQTIQINFPGGIISPGYLLSILEIAEAAKVSEVRFGQRQQLLIEVSAGTAPLFADHVSTTPNIISSYPANGIFISNSWLSEGIYKDVFEMLNWEPKLKINVCDSRNTFTPFFTGHLNWIAGAQPNYWHLVIRYPKSNHLFAWPELLYTNHIGELSRQLETQLLNNEPVTGVPVEKELKLPDFHLPYYEGFNKYDQYYWLGIYRRNEYFPVSFLKGLCHICLETKTGQLYATPWKSLIIRNIEQEHRPLWDYLLGKYGINVRHAANELNWQIPDNNEDALVLKRHIIRYFDNADVRTYGLCFSVGHHCFGGIVITQQESKYKTALKGQLRYDISYTPDFNPNSGTLINYRSGVAKEHLGPYITSLCKSFYERHSTDDPLQGYVAAHTSPVPAVEKQVYQCPACLSIYDEQVGDPDQSITPNTPFEQITDHYHCPLCEAPAGTFNRVVYSTLIV